MDLSSTATIKILAEKLVLISTTSLFKTAVGALATTVMVLQKVNIL